jgi:Na+/phosphate symporter
MQIVAILPWLVCIAGLVIYFASTRAEVKEAGRMSFACGLLVSLLVTAKTVVWHLP